MINELISMDHQLYFVSENCKTLTIRETFTVYFFSCKMLVKSILVGLAKLQYHIHVLASMIFFKMTLIHMYRYMLLIHFFLSILYEFHISTL